MTRALRTPRSLALVLALLLALMSAGLVSAHAKLKSSIPAADSTVATAPRTVVAAFDNHDPLNAAGSLLKVADASGAQVDLGDTALDKSDVERKTLVVSLKDGLAGGTYTVSWTAASEGDGSTAQGSFKFSVGEAAAPAAPANLPTTGGGGALPLAAVLAAAALLFGAGATLRRRI
jgi:methionine-rich copper-binding protein CopC